MIDEVHGAHRRLTKVNKPGKALNGGSALQALNTGRGRKVPVGNWKGLHRSTKEIGLEV